MDDLISRQAAIDALAKNMPSLTTPDGCGKFDHDIQVTDEAYVDCMQIIHELPSAQLDIILCPNCRYNDGTAYCELHYRDVKAKDFCSWAERRTDE